jgi:cellulose synthase/poly-beta-1,6-N-acetylglucosamine synthase-like glycosyltransferase
MLSIIITAKNEAQTIGRAIEGFLKQPIKDDFEIIVVAPDRQTLKAAKQAWPKIKMIQDRDRGKAMAMNLAIQEAQGDKLIFSDGDVEVDKGAVNELLKIEADAVSGRPVAINKLDNKFGWWQMVLTDMAHKLRTARHQKNEFVLLTGYLFLIKKKVLEGFSFPEGALAEDEYLSYWAWQRGYKIKYAGQAKVKVKFPDNYRDWVKQKVRTLGGSFQIPKEWKTKTQMRSFKQEGLQAWQMWKSYVKNFKQAYWMKLLFLARLDVWLLAWLKVKIFKQDWQKIWQRVESTK